MMKKYIILLTTTFLFMACKVEPKKIEYGVDACHFCKMTIVDQTHASEIVTKKGRDYKYDAIECMLQDLDKRDVNSIALFLVTDYTKPTILIDAKKAVYLISKEIKSPMGAFLSAFSNKESIKVKGKIYSWEEINKHFN